MKSNLFFPKVGIITLILILASATNSWARTTRAREFCGDVQTIDRDAKALTIVSKNNGQALRVTWRPDTKFIQNGKFADAGTLQEQGRVCVYYRSPFFGKSFVTKVVWQNGN